MSTNYNRNNVNYGTIKPIGDRNEPESRSLLERTVKTAYDTEEIGDKILSNLGEQGKKLEETHDKVFQLNKFPLIYN